VTELPRPPGPEWTELVDRSGGAGYLSVYLSDRLARYPVRDVTRRKDNKSDPNLETGTYGLFSTCEEQMRGKLVEDGQTHLFFLTTPPPGPGRVLAGYYEVGWCAESTGGAASGDFALAARRLRFVAPVPVAALPPASRSACTGFRSFRPIDPAVCREMRDVVDVADDLTHAYRAEIDRLERYAAFNSGFRYPSWGRRESFRLADGQRFLGAVPQPPGPRETNTGRWRCRDCGQVSVSEARLKSCPTCAAMGSLQPEAS
jgi:hypothetical protein